MSNQFFSIETLEKGTRQMVQVIKSCANEIFDNSEDKVLPDVKPGFLRNQLSETAPEEGQDISSLIQMSKRVLFPGNIRWQSPKFFGYFPCSVNVTNVLADMFTVINQTPCFSFATSPAFTELQNILVDWCVKAMGLPQKFLLKNSGGGIINNSASESIFNSLHAAKYNKMRQLNILGNNPDVLKFVGYFGQGGHVSSQRALSIKDIYYRRSIPYVYNPQILNYELDVDFFEKTIEEDVKSGLIPLWFGFNYGATFSAAVEASQKAIAICKKYKVWTHIDAAFLGSTWFCEKYQPSLQMMQDVDSFNINFSMLMMNAMGCTLFYVADKNILTSSMSGAGAKFTFYKNAFTGQPDVIDYKDWNVALGRRTSAVRVYYTLAHYGLKKIRSAIQSQEEKAQHLVNLIQSYPQLFKIHTVKYSVVTFQVLGKDGNPSNEITKQVAATVNNVKQGFISPANFNGNFVVRLAIGNFHTKEQHVTRFFEAVLKVASDLAKQ